MAQQFEHTTGDPDQADVVTNPRAVERRVWRNTLVVASAALTTAALLAELRVTLGLALGCVLGLLNFRWLQSSLRAALAVGGPKTPPGTSMKFLLRWLVILAGAFIATRTGYVDAVGLTAGLFAPALAILIEASYVAVKTIAPHPGE